MFNWKIKATNAIYLEDSNGQQGRPFKSRFLQAGLVKYDFGVCLLQKETIDRFINTFMGVPVIIDHKDNITESDKVGSIDKIWFSPEDGWFWCSGVITDNTAVKLIEQGYNVSCQYSITEYADNVDDKLHNGNPYDKEILNGVFEHLAIVENPRYEGAYIAVNAYIASNAIARNGGNGSGNFEHDGRPGEVGGSLPRENGQSEKENKNSFFEKWENAPEIELKSSDWDKISDIQKLRSEVKTYLLNDMRKIPLQRKELGEIRFSGKSIDEFIAYSADRDKLLAAKQLPQFIEQGKLGEYFDSSKDRNKQDSIKGFYPIFFNLKTPTGTRKAEILIAKDNNGKLFFDMFLDYDRDKAQLKRALNGNLNPVALNYIIIDSKSDFNPNATNSIYNKVFDYLTNSKGEQMDNKKDIISAMIDALKARNEADEKKEDEKKEETASNESVDKRDLIRQIMAIAGKHEDNEDVRTIAKLAEKLAYDKSEADTADNESDEEKDEKKEEKKDKKDDEEAKNKCKNAGEDTNYEELYKELKAKVDEEAANKKAKNSMDELVNQLYKAVEPEFEPAYISPKQGIELGKKIYG